MIEEEIDLLRERVSLLERALELAIPDVWQSCDVQGHRWTWTLTKSKATQECSQCGFTEDG